MWESLKLREYHKKSLSLFWLGFNVVVDGCICWGDRIYEIHPCISPFGPARKQPLKMVLTTKDGGNAIKLTGSIFACHF